MSEDYDKGFRDGEDAGFKQGIDIGIALSWAAVLAIGIIIARFT